MLNEFRRFLLRGNVIYLGIGIMMGIAFKSVIDSLVADMMTPLIAAAGGQTDFSLLAFTVNGSTFGYGNFINVIHEHLSDEEAVITTRVNTKDDIYDSIREFFSAGR